jgi:hypothetical protein
MTMQRLAGFVPSDLRGESAEPELIELSLLIPQWQVSALERTASKLGITAGQMLRRVLGEFCLANTTKPIVNCHS